MPRPAKSATLQLIQGNPNKKNTEELAARAEHEKKMKMRSDNIKPPSWLDKVGKKEFKRVAALLTEVEIITEADISMLAAYCNAYSQYVSISKIIEEDGIMVHTEGKDKDGNPIKLVGEEHPLLKRQKNYFDQMKSAANDFGLTPSARAKLAITRTQEEREKTAAEKEFKNV
ncbi:MULTISPECIES: phage terminase small subunit P27 family [Bacillus]|uniref:phage terminase small subunit P27 family n=1 Tax=Bacillus TaxID=1386 RepID=UPI001A427E3A|nr:MULTISPECIES: phage terminase small subunit P27 family [Bacillus]MBL3636820.1 phage terminase small subunit P27 family [Alkalicoccobacillus gibsonii]MCY7782381.1 phage terminase small subunit P27 family [Bacillus sp. S20C3]MCY8287808.1 phage terminase small subunit P27 family [Bacillus sp. N13C7]MCY8639917.1 phage terminase small subunit P27 family [Bacillus sp. S17B2]MCY9142947.1 phage terminase small subunit P27 family [Bacillus sp. T9C1]MED3386542.1 phage terminase small subunit P27 fam